MVTNLKRMSNENLAYGIFREKDTLNSKVTFTRVFRLSRLINRRRGRWEIRKNYFSRSGEPDFEGFRILETLCFQQIPIKNLVK